MNKPRENQKQQILSDFEDALFGELRRALGFELVERPSKKPGPVDAVRGESLHVIPDLVLRDGSRYIALELAAANSTKNLRAVAVRRAAQAERLRQQLPADSLLLLVIQGPSFLHDNRSPSAPRYQDLSPESVDSLVRSSANAALRKPGFDAVIFLGPDIPRALLAIRNGRRITYAETDLAAAVERSVEIRDQNDSAQFFQPYQEDDSGLVAGPPLKSEYVRANTSVQERYLLVADELEPAKGGISSLNLELAKALRRYGREVCIALPYSASETDRQVAESLGITLAQPANEIPGIQGPPAFLTGIRYPTEDFRPTVIVGHGRILGPYAYAIQKQHPSSIRVHLVHMHAEELERAKELDGGEPRTRTASQRSLLEIELASSAEVVAGVGKKLTDWIGDQVLDNSLFRERGGQVCCLRPGLRQWPENQLRIPSEKRFLITARAEDFESKGIDIAIRAVGEARMQRPNYPDTIGLIIRGVPEEHSDIKHKVESIASPFGYQPILRPFTVNQNEIIRDLRTSVAVLMPSRTEGFGLSAYEAMAAGVPTLISGNSGVAGLIREIDGTVEWPREVLRTDDEQLWVNAILRILDDPASSYHHARSRMESISDKDLWPASISELESAIKSSRG